MGFETNFENQKSRFTDFFDGQNSQLYHIANKIGQTFRYSLCMYELKRKIGDDIYMYFWFSYTL